MGRGIRKRLWTTKPPVGTPIDWNSPSARGLTSAWLFNDIKGRETSGLGPATTSPTFDLVTQHRIGALWLGSVRSDISQSKNQGVRIFNSSTNDYIDLGLDSTILTTANGMTIVIAQQKTDSTNRNSASFGVATGTDTDRCGAHIPYGDGVVYWDYGGFGAGNRVSVSGLTFGDDIWVFTTGARGQEIWQNGFIRASNSNNGTRTASTAQFRLGGAVQGNSPSDLVQYNFMYLYKKQLGINEVIAISREPFRLFVSPAPRIRYFITAAAAAPLTTTKLSILTNSKLSVLAGTKVSLKQAD